MLGSLAFGCPCRVAANWVNLIKIRVASGRRLVVLHARPLSKPAPKICTSIDPPYPIIAIYTSYYSPLSSAIRSRFLQWAKIDNGWYIRR